MPACGDAPRLDGNLATIVTLPTRMATCDTLARVECLVNAVHILIILYILFDTENPKRWRLNKLETKKEVTVPIVENGKVVAVITPVGQKTGWTSVY